MKSREEIDIIEKATWLLNELKRRKIPIRSDGYPDLRGMDYALQFPDGLEIWPYEKRRQARNKGKTLLVFYEGDQNLYGYLNKLDEIIAGASGYFAVAGFDISPCVNDLIELQRMALLLNSLVNAYLMVNGIRVVPSLRTGSLSTIQALRIYPERIAYAAGVLGCHQGEKCVDEMLFKLKLMIAQPSCLAVYGTMRERDRQFLDSCDIPYVSEDDYRTRRFAQYSRKAA